MLRLSVSKKIIEDIIADRRKTIEKEASRYWKKEILDVSLVKDKIVYKVKKIDKIVLSNGFSRNAKAFSIECKKISYNKNKDSFKFYLGDVLEIKNIEKKVVDLEKDMLIEKLLREKEELEKKLSELKKE